VAIAGRGVEREIGKSEAGAVGRAGKRRGKDEAFRSKPGAGRRGAEVGDGLRQAAQQPEQAAGRLAHNVHPNFKYFRINLVRLVEAGEDEACWWQADLFAAGERRDDGATAVVRLVAVGQADHGLTETMV